MPRESLATDDARKHLCFNSGVAYDCLT